MCCYPQHSDLSFCKLGFRVWGLHIKSKSPSHFHKATVHPHLLSKWSDQWYSQVWFSCPQCRVRLCSPSGCCSLEEDSILLGSTKEQTSNVKPPALHISTHNCIPLHSPKVSPNPKPKTPNPRRARFRRAPRFIDIYDSGHFYPTVNVGLGYWFVSCFVCM